MILPNSITGRKLEQTGECSFWIACPPYIAADGLKEGTYQLLNGERKAVAMCSLSSNAEQKEADVIDISCFWFVDKEAFLERAQKAHAEIQATVFHNLP